MKAVRLSLLFLALALPLQAGVFTVTKTADTLDGACDHDCSLREAVTASNEETGADFVVLGPGVYELTRLGPFEDASATGDLDVLDPLTILGAGAGRTILDGSGIDRVLHSTGQHILEVHGVTVRNGWARGTSGFEDFGGGIAATYKVILVDSVVSDNRAQIGGGIWASQLTARGSTISGNVGIAGGGIFSAVPHLSNVTLSGNLGRHGGGMYHLVDLEDDSEIADTTVTGNIATVAGGGLYSNEDAACPPSGGLCADYPYIRIERSVVAGNTAPAQPDCANLQNEGSFNVFGVGESCLAGPTDRAGTLAAPLDPRLGPLADNGGPTPTHALLPGSPAIDMDFPGSCPVTDQRGWPRLGWTRCDSGSFEVSPGCLPTDEALCLAGNRFRATVRWTAQGESKAGRAVPLTSDTGAFWFFEPDNLEMEIKVLYGCGLNDRFWIFLSGLTDVEVEVTVEDTLTGQTWEHRHAGGSPLPTLLDTDALGGCTPGGGTGAGDDAETVTPAGSVFRVTITNDLLDGGCDANCSLREAVRAANERPGTQAIVLGPGVYTLYRKGRGEDAAFHGDLDVTEDLVILGAGAESTILDGNGTDRVLHVLPAGSLEIHGVTIRNGRAAAENGDFGYGGGIQADGPLTVVRCLVTGNRAEWDGGGIFDRGRLTVHDSTVSDNTAQAGGGIYDWRHETPEPKLRLTNVTISGNRAEYAGGAAVDHVDTEIAHLTVTGNHATRVWGGFLRNECGCVPEDPGCCGSSHFVMSRSLIAGNTDADGAPDCDITENGGGFNLFGVGAFCAHEPTDRAGTEAAPLDPRLSPLGDHGGPTPTHLPLPGSPAIDSAGEACAGTDQRGVLRPVDGDGNETTLCDAGAVEIAPGCLPGPTRLCLQGGRFRVTVRWTAQGSSGPGRTVPLTADTGAFWFFDRANLEMTVKVLDGCGLNDRFWVFLSGLTDVGVEVRVEDTQTGETWTHVHAAGTALQPRLDTNALDCVNL